MKSPTASNSGNNHTSLGLDEPDMRIALVHNATAGEGVYESTDLTHLFREAGHEITAFGKKMRHIESALATGADVLAVAGGDGTVAKAAIATAERGLRIPLLILPVGTANNIARSLRIDAAIPVLIESLAAARTVRLDIGRIASPWGDGSFVESAGLGFIGKMLHDENKVVPRLQRFLRNLSPRRPSEVVMAARGVARLIRRQRERHYAIVVDGEDLSGRYIAVEAMNIAAIGPRTVLAPHADPGDGMLDVLLVRVQDRETLAEYVESRRELRDLPAGEFRRAREVEISWSDKVGHVDDEPWPNTTNGGHKRGHKGRQNGERGRGRDGDAKVRIGVQGFVNVLVP